MNLNWRTDLVTLAKALGTKSAVEEVLGVAAGSVAHWEHRRFRPGPGAKERIRVAARWCRRMVRP